MSQLERLGMYLRATWRTWIALAVAVTVAIGGIVAFVITAQERREAEGRSALQNCQQIEIVKDQIRGTVAASLVRIPQIFYYREHPDELAQTLKDTRESIRRFKATDCYALPVVTGSGLRPPKQR